MNRSIFIFSFLALLASIFFSPLVASAHEVYVLTPAQIHAAVSMPSQNPFNAVPSQELLFLEWGAITAVVVLVTLTFSISKLFQKVFDPFLLWLKKFAPFIARITFGVSLITAGYFHSFFGPELPASLVLSPILVQIVGVILVSIGFLIIIGFLTRIMSLIALCIFAFTIFEYGFYMLTYVNYLGEMILFIILGGGKWSLDTSLSFLKKTEKKLIRASKDWEKYSFLVLRILFGTALFFASFYAKFLHSNLALDTVNDYHLTNYFHFTPLFLVLGAFIIEALLGICFIVGFEIRFAALFFTFFLTLSLIFFGEVVWPHIILFGVTATLFCHGYDKYTLEVALFQRKKKGEPIF